MKSKKSALETWPFIPLKHLCRMNPSILSETTDAEFQIEYIDIGNVTFDRGIEATQALVFGAAPSRARKKVFNGDTLISTVRTYLRATAYIDSNRTNLVASTGFAVLRPLPDIEPRFLYRSIQASSFIDAVVALSTGVSYPAINPSTLGSIKIPVPPRPQQKAIVVFLEFETARIDQLIERKQRLVHLLREKRAAVITHAVTQGINPKAPKKESGEAWLGMIPSHWQVVPPTALFTESKERARESDQMLSATQKYGVIPLAEFEELEQRQVTMAVLHLDRRKHVEVGDFVISMRSMDGGLERARAVGSVRSSYSVLKAGRDVDGRFYGALLKSSLYIQALRQTANFIRDGQDMNFSHFRKVRLPKLPVTEQTEIADYIEAETSRIDALMKLTEQSVERLREYRAALITAAVTGQIDVANWSRRGTANARLEATETRVSV